jgi:hypothetical protein
MTIKCRQMASHYLYYAVFLLVLTNLGFMVRLPVTRWHLPVSFLLYGLLLLVIRIRRKVRLNLIHLLPIFATLLLLIGAGSLASRTYDTTYDGQLYQQTAVIALAQGWNPIWDNTLPIAAPTGQYGEDGEFGKPFVLGYPKSLWTIQSAIHLASGHIQVATVTNFLAGTIAFIWVGSFLRNQKMHPAWASVIAGLAVLSPPFLVEFSSFMQDGFGYQLSLIAGVALLDFMSQRTNASLLTVGAAWLLLAGSKYSNLPLLAVLAVITVGYLILSGRWLEPAIYRRLGLLILAGAMMLFSSYGVNTLRYGSPIYPNNTAFAQADVEQQNTTINLRNQGRIARLFYGIFAKPLPVTPADHPANVASLKWPFTFSFSDLSQLQSERVGAGGIFYSGLMIISVAFLAVSLLRPLSTENNHLLITITAIILLIVLCALALPVPNVLRLSPLLAFIPILTLIGMVLMTPNQSSRWLRIGQYLFTLLIIINTASLLIPTAAIRLTEFSQIRQQLQMMKNSHATYQVYAYNFYSSYWRLQEKQIPFQPIAKVECASPGIMILTYSTSFCPALSQ